MTDQGQLWKAGRVVIKGRRGRKVTCLCGECPKCKHRDYMRNYYYGVRRGRTPSGSEERRRLAPNKDGYIEVSLRHDDPLLQMARNDRVVLEHRLVMGRHLKRPLRHDEHVHHRNGDKTDNRIENLELWVGNHPKGQRVQDKLAWALAFVDRYGHEFAPE